MESLKNEDFARVLGVYLPWVVKSLELSTDSDSLTIIIEKQAEKGRFSFLTSNKKQQQVTRRWQHVRIGHYSTYIQATMALNDLAELTESHCPAFLGLDGKKITRELDETIRIAHSRTSLPDIISGLLGVSPEIIETKIREIETEDSQAKKLAVLPLESDAVWRDILLDKTKLTTRLLPLKLLLSRLKLDINRNPDDKALMQRSSAELRNFFDRHALQLKSEYEQVGATQNRSHQSAPQTKVKLVLPSTQNPIWHSILMGEMDLPTSSMPLQLSLAHKKNSYRSAETKAEQLDIIRSLQIFFKRNAKKYISELKFLTEMISTQQTASDILPPQNHDIWKKLLTDDKILSSEKINYRLFLSKEKSKYLKEQDEECLKNIRDFFFQNSRSMKEEIALINSLAKAS
ncbi:hypothetical protein KO489_10895 [Reinekea forsetii]|nr:hypothetical protein [Reinekea forsetii]